ncbi:MAG: DUF799 family lipoprotein [Thermodesulfovibrionales bacterium]|nr:DUF799 family lipoprotein [Thermodesulfovibrionales bacterium]
MSSARFRLMWRLPLLVTVLFALFFAVGCVSLPPPNPYNPVAKVAVLMMMSQSNDLDGPVFVRRDFNRAVPSRYYETIDLEQIDQVLNEKMGVTLGGQLDYTNPGAGAPTPQQVGETLGADGLFYGNLIEFKQLITGIYNKRQVKAKFWLVNAKSGEVMWEQEAEHATSEMNLSVSGALQAIAKKAIETSITKAFKANPLQQETNMVVERLRKTIPSGPVAPAKK